MNMSAMQILLKHKSAQHRVHWALGILRHLKQFSTPQLFLIGRGSPVCPSASNAHRWVLVYCPGRQIIL